MSGGNHQPSLYELLKGSFSGGLALNRVAEQDQVILSVLDNMQRILNTRAGSLSHIPDYGLPDMTRILQGMPTTAHQLLHTLSEVLLKYEPRLRHIDVVILEQSMPGELRYGIEAKFKEVGLVRYGTEFAPEGKVIIRHLREQQYIDYGALQK
ncbi:type VI secretion system baseplate subunit TssE (plasmid) [Pantoea sp. BJ2]|uniref:Type VI secretion system baseplate subunit TssE n=1 Tax=Pantoea sp. BJ2 TaxID=3141322 RepID=A0AAU7U4A0_9GAMM